MRTADAAAPVLVPGRRDRLIAGYAALALVVELLAATIPAPLPGVRPALATIVIAVALQRHGWSLAAWATGLQVLGGAIATGTLGGPTFWLAAAGALATIAVLGVAQAWNRVIPAAPLSVLGIVVLAMVAQVLAQFALVSAIVAPHADLQRLLPVALLATLVLGIATGVVGLRIVGRLKPVGGA